VSTRHRAAFSIGSGILYAAAFPPLGWWACMPLSLLLFFAAARNATPRLGFRVGFLQGMTAYALSLWWFHLIFGPAAVILFMILSVFTGLFAAVYAASEGKISSHAAGLLFTAAAGTAIEFFRAEIYVLRFPWCTPGTAMGPTWLTPVVGVYGMSFLIYAGAAGCLEKSTRGLGILLCTCIAALGVLRPGPIEPPGRAVTAAAVQLDAVDIERLIAMSEKAVRRGARLIVWPEHSVPWDISADPAGLRKILSFTRRGEVVLVLGTKRTTGIGPREWLNTALTIEKGSIRATYVKNRPVPFINDGIPGRDARPAPTGYGLLGTPICFDCDFTAVTRRMAAGGARLFAVPSYDPASWSEVQHGQHALLFRIRAAETGRWFVVAAGVSISQIIDPHGCVHATMEPGEQGVITAAVGLREGATPYTAAGWLFPWFCILSAWIVPVVHRLHRVLRKNKKGGPE